MRNLIRFSGLLLALTGAAKLASAVGGAKVLKVSAPILGVSFRELFILIGLCELALAACLLFGSRIRLQAGLLAWFATNVLIYRAGLVWTGYHRPCRCLGTLTDAINLSPDTADAIMKMVLAFLLIASYSILFIEWRTGSRFNPPIAGK